MHATAPAPTPAPTPTTSRTIRISRLAAVLAVLIGAAWCGPAADAQITPARTLSSSIDPAANLEEILTNRLKAVADDQRGFIRLVVARVQAEQLPIAMVVAIQRYAIRRNPSLPFPVFERTLRFEARKRGINLPPVRTFASTRQGRTIR